MVGEVGVRVIVGCRPTWWAGDRCDVPSLSGGGGGRSARIVPLCRLVVGCSGVFSRVPSWLLGLFRAFPEEEDLRNYGNGDVTSRHLYKFGCVIL